MICTSCRAPHYGPRSLATGLCEACERIYRATPPAPVAEKSLAERAVRAWEDKGFGLSLGDQERAALIREIETAVR